MIRRWPYVLIGLFAVAAAVVMMGDRLPPDGAPAEPRWLLQISLPAGPEESRMAVIDLAGETVVPSAHREEIVALMPELDEALRTELQKHYDDRNAGREPRRTAWIWRSSWERRVVTKGRWPFLERTRVGMSEILDPSGRLWYQGRAENMLILRWPVVVIDGAVQIAEPDGFRRLPIAWTPELAAMMEETHEGMVHRVRLTPAGHLVLGDHVYDLQTGKYLPTPPKPDWVWGDWFLAEYPDAKLSSWLDEINEPHRLVSARSGEIRAYDRAERLTDDILVVRQSSGDHEALLKLSTDRLVDLGAPAGTLSRSFFVGTEYLVFYSRDGGPDGARILAFYDRDLTRVRSFVADKDYTNSGRLVTADGSTFTLTANSGDVVDGRMRLINIQFSVTDGAREDEFLFDLSSLEFPTLDARYNRISSDPAGREVEMTIDFDKQIRVDGGPDLMAQPFPADIKDDILANLTGWQRAYVDMPIVTERWAVAQLPVHMSKSSEYHVYAAYDRVAKHWWPDYSMLQLDLAAPGVLRLWQQGRVVCYLGPDGKAIWRHPELVDWDGLPLRPTATAAEAAP